MIAAITLDALAESSEQREFRAAINRFLLAFSSEAAVRAAMDTDDGFDRDVWARLARELELPGLIIPTEYGGSGSTFVELAIALEEMGRALLCAPYFSTVVLATHAILASGDRSTCARYLPRIATGELTATLAYAASPRWPPPEALARADGYELTGSVPFVLDGRSAGLVIVAARTRYGLGLFAVDAPALGMTATAMATLDGTRKLARIDLAATPARRIGALGGGAAVLDGVLDLAAVGLAAEQAGGAQRVLEQAVGYAKTREQFGVPIGSFQAVKHKLVAMMIDVESAISISRWSAWAAANAPADLPVAAAMAKSKCSDAYTRVAEASIRLHGAIGFTWEYGAQLYYKRAKSSELLFGTPREHRARLADRLGL